MRKLDNTPITDAIGMPVKAGTWEHLQLAYQEALTALAQNLIGPGYVTTVPYVLYGCVNTGSGLNYVISAGAIYYNGEIYLVSAVTFTATSGHVAVGSIGTTFYTNGDRADPVTFTDGGGRNVHQIRKIVFANGTSGSTIFDFSVLKQTSIALANDQQATLGSSYVVKFDQDKAVYFASATVDTEITFDFTHAIPGAVVRLKWAWGSGRALTITPGSGNVAYAEGGDITRADGATNTMYLIYVGKNDDGDNEVGYSISQVA